MSKVTNVIFLGTSQLLYNCARKVRNYYHVNVKIKVIDISDSITQKKKKLNDEFGNTREYSSKSEIADYLEQITEQTILFSINNPYIIPERVCVNQNLTMINLHHSLLPKHPGRNAEAWTIYEQDVLGGISWHFINQGIDSGAILYQKEIAITKDITSLKLLRLCEKTALDSFDIFLPLDRIERMPVIEYKGKRELPKKAIDIPNNGLLELNWSVDKCLAFLNALNYGGIDVLGLPRVEYQNTYFIVKKYQIKHGLQQFNERIGYYPENNVLELRDEKQYLMMTLEKIRTE